MRQYLMTRAKKKDKITVEAKAPTTDTLTPNEETGPLSRAEMDGIDAIDQKAKVLAATVADKVIAGMSSETTKAPLSQKQLDGIESVDKKERIETLARNAVMDREALAATVADNATPTAVLAADNTATYINNFKSDVAKAVDADEKGQSYRATALRSLSLLGLETMTDDILTVSDITTYAQEVLCAALGVDWKKVADEDNLLATRGIYKEVLWVLTFLNASGASCDPDGNAGRGVCITDGKKRPGMIWLKTRFIPEALREEDAPPVGKFSFKKVLGFSKAYFAKVQPGKTGSDAHKAFTSALAFADNLILMAGETKDNYPDDKVLPADAELLVEGLFNMASFMYRAIEDRNNGSTRASDVTSAANE